MSSSERKNRVPMDAGGRCLRCAQRLVARAILLLQAAWPVCRSGCGISTRLSFSCHPCNWFHSEGPVRHFCPNVFTLAKSQDLRHFHRPLWCRSRGVPFPGEPAFVRNVDSRHALPAPALRCPEMQQSLYILVTYPAQGTRPQRHRDLRFCLAGVALIAHGVLLIRLRKPVEN